ncbi:MAG: D-alanyl-D-alanine carboxypeptidase family protein [Candidatus Saccharibacteria bacterium]
MLNLKNGLGFLALLTILWIPQKANEFDKPLAQVKGLAVFSESAERIPSAPELATAELPPDLLAKTGLAYDNSSGTILYSRNMDEKLPIASVTKLMTALVVMDRLDLDRTIEVKAEDIRVVGSNMGLVPGERIKGLDLLKGMLIPSSNDAAKVLAAAAGGTEENFVGMMNQKAKDLGLDSTHFSNPVGLDDPENYSSGRDLLRLAQEFIKDDTLNSIASTKSERVASTDGKLKHDLRSTNKLLLEDGRVIGLKTGYTSLAKGNLITRIEDGGKDIITIILNSDEREEDTRKLINWVTAAYRW